MAGLNDTQKQVLYTLAKELGPERASALCDEYYARFALHPESMEMLLRNLLDGTDLSAEEINSSFKGFTGTLFREYTVLVLESDHGKMEYNDVLQGFSMLPEYWCFRYEGRIVCLNAHNTSVQDSSEIRRIISKYGLVAGGSRPFSDLSDLKTYYQQALETMNTLKILQRRGCLAQYDDFLMLRLFDCLREDTDLSFFALPDIRTLQEYDKQHRTELCRTMLCYLQHSKNVAGTAAELNVHRNTVHYRIDKCTQILSNLDFENDYITFLLMLSLHIAEYDFYRLQKWQAGTDVDET